MHIVEGVFADVVDVVMLVTRCVQVVTESFG
jgi:hypothetical protein